MKKNIFLVLVTMLVLISSSVLHYASAAGTPTVTSLGQEQPYILTEFAMNSSHNQLLKVLGITDVTRKESSGALKQYLFVYVNPKVTSPINLEDVIASGTIASASSNEFRWDVMTPNDVCKFSTVEQDVDTLNGVLSEWQHVDGNSFIGGGSGCTIPSAQYPHINYSGTYGSAACTTNSGTQDRRAVYVQVVDVNTGDYMNSVGAMIFEQEVNGTTFTSVVVYLSGEGSKLNTGDVTQNCGETLNPATSGPNAFDFRWGVRSPSNNNPIPGNFGDFGTLGEALQLASPSNVLQIHQFINRTVEIPNSAIPGSNETL